MRVITGTAKGRRLLSVPGEGTRPITDRVKEALFSILGPSIEEARMLDLFAGTGSVGIEALSRGAEEVVFVDRSHKAIETLRKNLEITGLKERAVVHRGDAFRYVRAADPGRPFDLIYVAPPQYKEMWAEALLLLDEKPLLAPEGIIIIQIHPKEYRVLPLKGLYRADERTYGSTVLHFYRALGAVPPRPEGEG